MAFTWINQNLRSFARNVLLLDAPFNFSCRYETYYHTRKLKEKLQKTHYNEKNLAPVCVLGVLSEVL